MTRIDSAWTAGSIQSTRHPEQELLVLCARTSLEAACARRLRTLITSGVDWPALLQAAAFHGLLPLLSTHIEAIGEIDVPPEVLKSLRTGFRANTHRNLALTTELLGLLGALESRGVLGVPYKGPVLAAAAYGHIGLRDFGDLDVLIRPEDVAAAKAALVDRGYRARFDFPPAQEAAFVASRHEHAFVRQADGVVVELQWAVVPKYFSVPIDPAAVWRRLVMVPIGDRRVPSLSPEDLLLVLAVHGTKHLWCRVGWACDVAELVRTYEGLDWGIVEESARQVGARRMVGLALALARDVLAAPVPTGAMARLADDPVVARLRKRVVERWWALPGHWPTLLESGRFHLASRERWADRLRYCVRLATVPTPGDFVLLPVPRVLSGLYYPLRAVRLAVKYGAEAGRRLFESRTRA